MVRHSAIQKEKAIRLRKQGLSYSQILKQVPIAKSTLSLWLKEVLLSKFQKQRITQKRLEAGLRGGASRHLKRLLNTTAAINAARKDIGVLSHRELWLLGVALYWAEGSKQRVGSVSNSVTFNNSDPKMLKFFKAWLLQVPGVNSSRLKFELYLHESQKHRLEEIRVYWAKVLSVPLSDLNTLYLKKNILKRVRKNPENGYYGLVRIRVRASTQLNRTIAGWIEGIVS
jgi:hypothetical protein